MNFAKRWTIGLVLALAASGAAFAGEDSTERRGGFGPAYWETSCGLSCFSSDALSTRPAAEQP